MPIIDLQRRLHEAGRIRIGMKVAITSGPNAGKERPIKLDRFRFTSQSRRSLDAVAQLYGGDVTHWDDAPSGDQWEVITEARELEVVVLPERMSFSQNYEVWSGGGCRRRCDGEYESLSEQACMCDPENRVCKPYTHLSLMLARIPGIGQWRLTTHGYYAATEIAGSIEMATVLAQAVGRTVLPGRLRVEAKSVKRLDDDGKPKTFNFPVPVLDFEVDMHALATGQSPIAALAPAPPMLEGPAEQASEPGLTPVPRSDAEVPSLVDQVAAVGTPDDKPKRANAAPAIPATGLAPRGAIEAESTDVTPPARPVPPPAPVAGPEAAEPALDPASGPREASGPATGAGDKPMATRAEAIKKATGRARAAAKKQAAPRAAAPKVTRSERLETGPKAGELRITEPQIIHLMRLFGLMNLTERDARLRYCRNVCGRDDITSSWDMSVAEGNTLIHNLKVVNGEEPPDEGETA